MALGEERQVVVAREVEARRPLRPRGGPRTGRWPAARRRGPRRGRRRAGGRRRRTTATASSRTRARVSSWRPVTTQHGDAEHRDGQDAAATSPSVRRVRNAGPRAAGPERAARAGSAGAAARRGRGRAAASSVVTASPSTPADDQAVADAADRQQVDRLVGIHLHLLPQAPHRDPDVARVGILRVGPATGEERLGGHGLAEVGGEGVQQPRLGRRQRHACPSTSASRRWSSSASLGPSSSRWRGTRSPSRRSTRWIRARSSG